MAIGAHGKEAGRCKGRGVRIARRSCPAYRDMTGEAERVHIYRMDF